MARFVVHEARRAIACAPTTEAGGRRDPHAQVGEGRGFVVEVATGRAIECKACLAVRKSVLCARAAERKAAARSG